MPGGCWRSPGVGEAGLRPLHAQGGGGVPNLPLLALMEGCEGSSEATAAAAPGVRLPRPPQP